MFGVQAHSLMVRNRNAVVFQPLQTLVMQTCWDPGSCGVLDLAARRLGGADRRRRVEWMTNQPYSADPQSTCTEPILGPLGRIASKLYALLS